MAASEFFLAVLLAATMLELGAARLQAPLVSASSLTPQRFRSGSNTDWLLIDGGGGETFPAGYSKNFWGTVCNEVTNYMDSGVEKKAAELKKNKPALYYKTKLLNSLSVLVENLYRRKKVNDKTCKDNKKGWYATNQITLGLGPRCDCDNKNIEKHLKTVCGADVKYKKSIFCANGFKFGPDACNRQSEFEAYKQATGSDLSTFWPNICKLPGGKKYEGTVCRKDVEKLEAEVMQLGKDYPLPAAIVRSVRWFSCSSYYANADPNPLLVAEWCGKIKSTSWAGVDLIADPKKLVSFWNILSDCVNNKDAGIRKAGVDAAWVKGNLLAAPKIFAPDPVVMQTMWKLVIPSGTCAKQGDAVVCNA